MILQVSGFRIGVNVGLGARRPAVYSLNNCSAFFISKVRAGQKVAPRKMFACIPPHFLVGGGWGSFHCWRPGNSQGQIFPQFTSESPKVLEKEMSPKLGQLDAHSWDLVSPESDKDGERERLTMRLVRLRVATAAAGWRGWTSGCCLIMNFVSQPPEPPRSLPVSQARSFMPFLSPSNVILWLSHLY